MTSKDYIKQAVKTEPSDYEKCLERLFGKEKVRLLHAAMGLSTESAEVLDAVKKHIYYGKDLDLANLVEELGDIFWYAAILVDSSASNQSFESIMEKNIAKLRARYGEKFSEKSAIKRDLAKERRAYA